MENNDALKSLKDTLVSSGYEDSIVFENPDYASAVIGISHDGRVIYSFEKMIEHLVETDGMDEDEAIEFIDYNTVRSIPYAGEGAPIIMYELIF